MEKEKVIGLLIIAAIALLIILGIIMFAIRHSRKRNLYIGNLKPDQQLKLKRKGVIIRAILIRACNVDKIVLTDEGVYSYDEIVIY